MTDEPDVSKAGEIPAPASRGIDEILADDAVAPAIGGLRDAIVDAREFVGELTLVVDRLRIREICESFRRNGYLYLVDITGVDYSQYTGHAGERFAVVYHLYSFDRNQRIRLKVMAADGEKVPSVTSVWKTANWPERETWDMFGIEFEGHPNLERILMWDGFNGHPLRKDFPVRGIDTGARIYPEVFPVGTGPMPGSTGKNAADVNLYRGEWVAYGTAPVSQPEPPKKALPPARPPATPAAGGAPTPAAPPAPASPAAAPAAAAPAASTAPADAPPAASPVADAGPIADATPEVTGASAADAPWHDENLTLAERMGLASGRGLRAELFAAMAQTDCGACGWDCEGYAIALDTGETDDISLCVPGEAETEDTLKALLEKRS
ncbi:MAG TPA: NADH-quinone oxidoreductase subunit C [Thermoanaerobaculia bacterium]|nr:NADH-quinone oxidoreductase subunit C [Thermoanaerobaculia bacterium]